MTRQYAEHAVAELADLPEGTHIVVEAGGRELGVFNIRGDLYALPNVCPHQNGPLCRGVTSGTLRASEDSRWKSEWILDGDVIVCPWHGLEFEIPTGRCLAYADRSLLTFKVKVVGDKIVVVLPRGGSQ
jgi:nitrite reductase/ring-hydroxylating ferredoxin subunit